MTHHITREAIDAALSLASTTRQLLFGPRVLGEAARMVTTSFPHRPVVIVADARTYEIAGRHVLSSFARAEHPVADPIIFPAEPTLRPDTRHVERIRQILAAQERAVLPLAVGSGTINDLTKRAAFEAKLPYMVVATAASMDGYTASGAALIHQGAKQTVECLAPVAVIADLDVLCAAPTSMTASGYGDLVGKLTAGADWLIADALEIEPIDPPVWEMVQGPLRGLIADPGRLQRGEPEAIQQLFFGLIITGLAIQFAGTTRPASGSEHQFSHLWEMRGLEHEGKPVSHGSKVALGSIVSTALYERLLACDLTSLDIDQAVARWPTLAAIEQEIRVLRDHPMLIDLALEECRAKYVPPVDLRARLELLRHRWPNLQCRLRQQLLSGAELQRLLSDGACPTAPEQIGLTCEQLRASYREARLIRRRYTVFDVVNEIGKLDQLVSELFAPGGYWSISATAQEAIG